MSSYDAAFPRLDCHFLKLMIWKYQHGCAISILCRVLYCLYCCYHVNGLIISVGEEGAALIVLLSITCSVCAFVRRGFFFPLVLMIATPVIVEPSLDIPYNYFRLLRFNKKACVVWFCFLSHGSRYLLTSF